MINFLRQVRLIVVDEVHAYTGVFGSNAAFLFRRLQHLLGLLGAKPALYLRLGHHCPPGDTPATACLGVDFDLIGPEYDTSPRFPLQVYLVDPPGSGPLPG